MNDSAGPWRTRRKWHADCSTRGVAGTAHVQVSESARLALLVALPIATLGCAMGRGNAPVSADAAGDAAGRDADVQVTADATPDAPGCAIAAGMTPALDGSDDLAEYPEAQRPQPGAMLGADAVAIAWDRTHLFVTVTSNAFTSAYEPLHVYIEAGAQLASATPATGKEYSGLVPMLPFAPTHLVAVRRVSDSGTGGAYNGVFVPSDGFTTRVLALDDTTFASADQQTLSVRVPWATLGGCPTSLRLALHVVHAQLANEWKVLVPSTHTPWQSPGGGHYEIDLTGALAVSAWTLR